jgi:hypothetical protein
MSEICPEAPETQAAPTITITYGGIHWGHYAAKLGLQLPFSAVDSQVREAIEAGARAVADAVGVLTPEPEGARYALVEQLGHRSMVGITRDITFCGKTMLEVQRIDVVPSVTVRVNPDTFYDVTDLTPEQAVAMARAYGRSTGGLDAAGVVTRAISEHRQITGAARDEDEDADPWGTAESDLDDADDADHDEGNDTEAEAKRAAGWIEDHSCRYDDEFSPGAAGEARDLTRQAEVNPIEAEAQRAVGWFEGHTAQRQM